MQFFFPSLSSPLVPTLFSFFLSRLNNFLEIQGVKLQWFGVERGYVFSFGFLVGWGGGEIETELLDKP